MKKITILLLLVVMSISSVVFGSNLANNSSLLYKKLKASKDVVSVEKMDSPLFEEKYVVMIKQPLDHKHPEKGEFTQRFFVSHVNYDAPIVLVTHGYGGTAALNPKYRDEISTKLKSNQVDVEHRYFFESTPEPCDWQYMNAENSANDLHRITTLLKEVYSGKWISTGISKGGQTTMIYRTYFPDDVDISVPYVGPICFGVEDGRHEPFLAQCGSVEDRSKILMFQREVLSRKADLIPLLKELSAEKKWDFRDMSWEEVIDYCVLEYPFAFWQWGIDSATIPSGDNLTDKEIFDHFMTVASADYFGDLQLNSFFVQAATDLGYYGYDTSSLHDLLTIKSADGYLKRLFLPADAKKIKFNHGVHKDMYKYLGKNDPKMILIYGETDPWTAAAPEDYLFEGKTNMKKYIQKGGSHKTRIGTMPQSMQDEIWSKIEGWLK